MDTKLGRQIQEQKSVVRSCFSKKTFSQRKTTYKRVYKEYESEPRVIQDARCLAAFLNEKEIIINKFDTLAGYAQFCDFRGSTAVITFKPDPSESKTFPDEPKYSYFNTSTNIDYDNRTCINELLENKYGGNINKQYIKIFRR